MFPFRFVLVLSFTLICVGSNDVSGYYVIPYGFDQPYLSLSEEELLPSTPEPIIMTMPPTSPPIEPTPPPPSITPPPVTEPPLVITPTPPQPPSPPVTMTLPPPVTTAVPPTTTVATPPPPSSSPTKMTCVCDCSGVPERCPCDPYAVKHYRQYNYYYPNSNRMPIPMPRPPVPNICELCNMRNRSLPVPRFDIEYAPNPALFDPALRPGILPPFPFIPNPYRLPGLMPQLKAPCPPPGLFDLRGAVPLPVPEPEPIEEPPPVSDPLPIAEPIAEPSPVPEPSTVPLPFPPQRYGHLPNGLVDPRVSVFPIGDPSMRPGIRSTFPYLPNTYGQSGLILQQNSPYPNPAPGPIELIDTAPLPVPEPAPVPEPPSIAEPFPLTYPPRSNRLPFRQSAPLRNPLTGQIEFIDPLQGPPLGPASVPALPQIDPLVPTFPGPNDRLTLLPGDFSTHLGPQSGLIPQGFPPVSFPNGNPLWYQYPLSANQIPNIPADYSVVV